LDTRNVQRSRRYFGSAELVALLIFARVHANSAFAFASERNLQTRRTHAGGTINIDAFFCRTTVCLEFMQKRFCFLCLPLVVAKRQELHEDKYVFLLCSP